MAGFERSPFGGYNTTVVQDVHNYFGPRTDLGPEGVVKTQGSFNEASWEITGADVGASAESGRWLVQPTLPAGAIITNVFLKVKEAFVLGGTSPTILFGTDTSEATNGFVISEARAEALGTYDITSTLTGTWAAPLAAKTTVGVALGGTSPTVTTAGRLEVIVQYALV